MRKIKKVYQLKLKTIKRVYQLKPKTIKEFNAKDEDELLEQVILWPKFDKEWDKGWDRIEPDRKVTEQDLLNRKYKYCELIKLNDDAKPLLSLCSDDIKFDSDGTYWTLPREAFDFEFNQVYLLPEYAKRFVWGVDADLENGLLNINVAYDPEGDVNCGAFCSFIDKSDVKELK